MKEIKSVSGTPESRGAMHEMMAAFEAFKGANDARLSEIEKKASADTLLEEKVARIDQGIFRDAASDALIREAFFDQGLKTWRLVVPDFGTLEGPFLVSALEYAGDHEGEATFAISLASGGAVAFAAA